MAMDSYPSLIVFDLDYTLWPFWVDTHVTPPFTVDSYDRIFDADRRQVQCFPEVPRILESLHQQGVKMAVASRTGCTTEAASLINLFGWDDYFAYRQIYPGDKKTHFQRIQVKSGIPFQKMLFFDDEQRNIDSVSQLGVTCVKVTKDGVTTAVLKEGLRRHSEKLDVAASPFCQRFPQFSPSSSSLRFLQSSP